MGHVATLILIRPALADDVAAAERLAEALKPFQPQVVVTAAESGPLATARTVARVLDLDMHSAGGIEERRSGETVSAALDRFDDGMAAIASVHPLESVAIVVGGVVLSGWLGRHCNVDPEVTETTLGQPSVVVVDRATTTISRVEAQI